MALLKVLILNVLLFIIKGLSIKEIIVGISESAKAALPILITEFGIVTEFRLVQLANVLSVDNQQLPR